MTSKEIMKILIVDTYCPEFLKSLPFDPNSTYEVELRKVLDRQFGTADFYSKNLKALGWDAVDVLYNHAQLQSKWCDENGLGLSKIAGANAILLEQIQLFKPDVVFMQDLSLPDLRQVPGEYILAGQHSCPWAGDRQVKRFDVLMTSFPHYIPRIEKLGVRAIYNPLAFEPSVLPADFFHFSPHMPERIHNCVFIGWSPLKNRYQGEAWGRDMYEILLRSKIVLNRHGEVAEGFANNMRMYEATGCGALLVTDNETDLFADDEIVRYSSPQDAVEKIRYYLTHEDERAKIAAKGQKRTLSDHTYAKRMKVVSDTLKELSVTT